MIFLFIFDLFQSASEYCTLNYDAVIDERVKKIESLPA